MQSFQEEGRGEGGSEVARHASSRFRGHGSSVVFRALTGREKRLQTGLDFRASHPHSPL